MLQHRAFEVESRSALRRAPDRFPEHERRRAPQLGVRRRKQIRRVALVVDEVARGTNGSVCVACDEHRARRTLARGSVDSCDALWLAREAPPVDGEQVLELRLLEDRKSTRLNSSHVKISYAVFCL